MSTSTLTIERTNWLTRVADYVELTKPRIGLLVLATVAVSYGCARWGQPDPLLMLHALLGTLFVASSASALNQWLERQLDQRMPRTSNRPLPSGRLAPSQAVTFAVVTIIIGEVYLAFAVNGHAAAWGLLTWFLYVWIYTPLKTRTPLNTAVGAVAGALPVLIGWSAAGAPYDLRAVSLFFVVFLWQFPHFMAIAWLYRRDYREAEMQMLPVVDPSGRRAGLQAVCGAVALLPVSLVPGVFTPGLGGPVYLIVAFALGMSMLAFSVAFWNKMTDAAARRLLRASLVYLPTLLLLILLVLWV